jgi:carbonic anhydrase
MTEITQPIVIIPLPSKVCNQDYNWKKNGRDWECECAEGREQSPINLPSIAHSIESPVKPLFQYERVDHVSKVSTIDGQLGQKSNLKLVLNNSILRIFHNKFGKIITVDGAVYFAEEIVIHTPAEHKIEGKSFDMEIQIVHYGQSKGDIAKQVILCFVFENTPGVYNKFIEDLDIFNLPNNLAPERDITNDLYIAKLLYTTEDNDIPIMKPFSFYTYQGSLTQPPCTENTIVYVASKPLALGSTAIQLFKEALRTADLITDKGEVVTTEFVPVNNRDVQPLYGRPVFHYDHEKYCGPDVPNIVQKQVGHYEKIITAQNRYFYVNSNQPSGVPNAYLVSENEALGKTEPMPLAPGMERTRNLIG